MPPTKHAPDGYVCPFCSLALERVHAGLQSSRDDIVYEDGETLAFVSSQGFGTRPGHLLVVPREHYENLYDLPDKVAAALASTVRRVAIALRQALPYQGTSTRQHNEPAGNQDVWHYHVHVFPRYEGDGLYTSERVPVPPERRMEIVGAVRNSILRTPLPSGGEGQG